LDPTLERCGEVAELGVGTKHTCSRTYYLRWADIESKSKAMTAE